MNNQHFVGMVDMVNRLVDGENINEKTSLRDYIGMVESVQKIETVSTQIDESDSDSQALIDKREEYMKDLKDKEDYFKEKYGDEWESVMYGTATNLAKKDLGMD